METNESPGWIRDGDRSHPNLVRLDQLKPRLSYPGWQNDFSEAEKKHFECPERFEEWSLFMLEEKQRMYECDRSHPRLVELDSCSFTYPGWEDDFKRLEEEHYEFRQAPYFHSMLQGMKNKERLHLNDRSHPDLVRLDSLKQSLSYPGWEEDFEEAEEIYIRKPGDFEDWSLFMLEEKQRMYEGDRSHPRLLELDSCSFTYPGWNEDVARLEEEHYEFKWAPNFYSILEGMKNKEQLHLKDRSHPDLVRLDSLKQSLSYPGWEEDFEKAEEIYIRQPDDFEDWSLFMLAEKQRMYEGDRTHPRLVELDSCSFTYPGWEDDFKKLEEEHYEFKGAPYFNSMLQGMKNKQRVFDGSRRHEETFDSNTNSEPGRTLPDSNCVICTTSPKTHAFVPCGHMCACEACATACFERSDECPICRENSVMVLRIFSS